MTHPTFAPNEYIRDGHGNLLFGFNIKNGHLPQAMTVSGTAVALPTSPLAYRVALVIYNNSNDIIYLGNSDVATTTGYRLSPQGQFIINIDDNNTIYAVSAGTNSDIRIWEFA